MSASTEDVIALTSSSVAYAGGYGDAMTNIYVDGLHQGEDKSSWSVNDVWTGAELTAPVYNHAYFPAMSGTHNVSLIATEFPWTGPGAPNGGEDSVVYNIKTGAKLVVLKGGMQVKGRGTVGTGTNNWADWACLSASVSKPWCVVVGTPVVITQGQVCVPAGHSGVVFLTGKTRIQAATTDNATFLLWIQINGHTGTTSVQQVKNPDGSSERTLTASYMTRGALNWLRAATPLRCMVKSPGRSVTRSTSTRASHLSGLTS